MKSKSSKEISSRSECGNLPAHTPTPWIFIRHDAQFPHYGHIQGSYGKDAEGNESILTIATIIKYASPEEGPANGAFIVRAVNAHDELVAALKRALEYWAHRQQRYTNRSPRWVVDARAAIAKARA